jgi:phosphopantetheinyl transferase (holo-ACP synthase)
MKFVIYIAIALLSLSSCTKETILEVPTTENTTKTLVSFSTADAVKNFVNGKWAWKETVLKSRAGQTQTTPATSGIQKQIVLNGQTVTVFENGRQTASENYTLTQTDKGWWFEGGNCSGILYRIGDQLIIVGSVVDKADDYFQRAQ